MTETVSIFRGRRGSMMLEFVLLVVTVIFLMLSVFEGSLLMWQYHTMAEAVQEGARYISAHGVNCTLNGNTCSVSVGTIATYIGNQAVGLDTTRLNITLNSSGSTVSCAPLSSCNANAAIFPPSAYNAVGSSVQVVAAYPMNNPIVLFWPGAASITMGSPLTLGATSTQRIMF